MINEDFKEYNKGSIRVYLASPFFNEEQLERITAVENLLEKYNFDVFSPRHASKIVEGYGQDDMLETFRGNVDHIDRADFILAILDGNDSGTLFECGYAFKVNKPILYFNETREKGPNLMLALSGKLPFITKTTSLESLLKYSVNFVTEPRDVLDGILEYISNFGVEKTIENTKNLFDEVE